MNVFNAAALAACAILAACAAEVVRHPSPFTAAPPATTARTLVLQTSVVLPLDTGRRRPLGAGTEFVEVGTLREGRVLKPLNATLTVVGRHHHEAYPVLQGARVVGFYLPVEQSFSPLSQPVELSLLERTPQ